MLSEKGSVNSKKSPDLASGLINKKWLDTHHPKNLFKALFFNIL
jgi:hypothetical protein